MYTRRSTLAKLAFAVLVGLPLYVPSIAAAAEGTVGSPVGVPSPTGVPTGSVRPATENDLPIMRAAGFPNPKVGDLWNPNDPAAGMDVGAAKQYLNTIWCGNKRSQCRGNVSNVEQLNPQFAVCAAKFLKAIRQRDSSVCIISAFRSVAHQQCLCGGGGHLCARPGRSKHQQGRAIDLRARNLAWVHVEARRFGGLGFPVRGDAPHMEPIGGNCATPGYWPSDPSSVTPYPATPSSGLTNAVRNLFNPQEEMCALPGGGQVPCSSIANRGAQQPLAQREQPQLQQPPPLGTQNTTPYAPGTCAPEFYCANSTYYYRSSTCVDHVYQKCPAGCSATSNTCASTSTSQSSFSAIDQIGLIAEPTSTPVGAVSDLLFELTISGDDIATLRDETAQSDTIAQDDASPLPPPLSQQTFVSSDLRYSQVEQYQPQQLSALQQALATMKDILLRVLAYLRPFGRPEPAEGTYDEWIE